MLWLQERRRPAVRRTFWEKDIWAARYNSGDVPQYNTGSKAEGIEGG